MTQHGQQDGDQPKFAWRDQYSASSWLWWWFAADEKLIISTVDVGIFFVFFLSCPTNSWEPTFICWPPESCFTILLILKLKPMSAALEHKVLKGEPLPGPFYLRHLHTDELKMQRPHYHHITSWKISFQKKQWKKLKFNRILHCDFCFRFSSAVSNKMRSQLHTLFSSFFWPLLFIIVSLFLPDQMFDWTESAAYLSSCSSGVSASVWIFRRSRSSRSLPDLKTQISNMFDIYNPTSGCLQRGGQLRLQAGHVCSGGVGGTSTHPPDSFVPYL